MPTGYTAAIKDGISFETFALNCARAFGACITMRDDDPSTPIPDEFKPSDYHSKTLAALREELTALEAMSASDAERAAAAAWDKAETSRLVRLENDAQLAAKYRAMLARARAWFPPTPEHQGLRDFMIQQIEESIKFDCGHEFDKTPTTRVSGEVWRAGEQARIARSLDYHAREHAAELQRAEQRTGWVRALRASLSKGA